MEPVIYMRQTAIFDPEETVMFQGENTPLFAIPIAIIGAGNIGSNTAIALTKMGLFNITIFDEDTIEAHNLSSQAYLQEQVGMSKTDALCSIIERMNDRATPIGVREYATGKELKSHFAIIISAVDSLEERRKLACAMAISTPENTPVIDGRMGGTQIEVHTTTAHKWMTIIPEHADQDPCASRYISFTAYGIASLIANNVRLILTGKVPPEKVVFDYQSLTSCRSK